MRRLVRVKRTLTPEGRVSLCLERGCPGFRACRECRNSYMRSWRAQGRENTGDPVALRARAVVSMALRRGTMQRGPCAVCGAVETQAHHDDHSRPRQVTWLCKLHHAMLTRIQGDR